MHDLCQQTTVQTRISISRVHILTTFSPWKKDFTAVHQFVKWYSSKYYECDNSTVILRKCLILCITYLGDTKSILKASAHWENEWSWKYLAGWSVSLQYIYKTLKFLSIQEESEMIGREGIFTYNLFEIDILQFCMLFSQPEWLWSLLCWSVHRLSATNKTWYVNNIYDLS